MNCPHCGEQVSPVEGQKYCSFCGGNLDNRQTDSETTASKDERQHSVDLDRPPRRGEYCPWEDQENLGFLPAIAQTVKQTLFRPDEFFARLPLRAGFVPPLLYALIIATLGEMLGVLWAFSLDNSLLEKISSFGNWAVPAAILIPVFVFIRIVLLAGLFHVSLYLLGGAHEDFEATFRVTCYSSAPDLCSIIPVIGGLLGMIWKVYVTLIGLSSVHRIPWWRAGLAVMLPFTACCTVMAGGFWMALTSLGGAAG